MKKIIALSLVLVSLVCLFTGCSGSDEIKVPTLQLEETLENRQAALVAAAKAYYHKNPYVQYDNQTMTTAGKLHGLRAQYDQENAPEYASEDLTVYDVCSAYVYDLVFQAIGYKLLENRNNCITSSLSDVKGVPEEIVIYQRTNEKGNTEANVPYMEEMLAMLQPGDVVTYYRYNGTGHTVLYCGDLDGDGKGDILHCDGGKYDFTTGIDEEEADGSIVFNHRRAPSALEFLGSSSFSEYLAKMDRYSLIRPALISSEEYPMTDSVKSRMLYPDMAIYLNAQCGNYGAVNADSTLTYTVTVKNNSAEDYLGVLLQFPVPAGTEIVEVNGAKAKNKTVKLELDLPAGQEVAIPITVKITAAVGTRIVAEGGYVQAIPLPKITTTVQKTSFDHETVKAAIAGAKGKDGAAFVNAVWQTLDPAAPAIPEYLELRDGLFDRKSVGELKIYIHKDLDKLTDAEKVLRTMWVEEYYGGMSLSTMGHNRRVLELRYRDLQAGDVVVFSQKALLEGTYGVFDGENLIVPKDGGFQTLLDIQFAKLLSYELFTVLRPTQAM